MAFDRPLEADRVDDFDLISTFARAPVIGTIMWMLGGDRARAKEEAERRKQVEEMMLESLNNTVRSNNGDIFDDDDEEFEAVDSVTDMANLLVRAERGSSSFNKPPPPQMIKSALKKKTPSLTGSDISDVSECVGGLDGMQLSDSYSGPFHTGSNPKLRRSKKALSWSDETGQSLVECKEFIGESQDREHMPEDEATIPTDMAPKPSSSLTRTRSVTSNAGGMMPTALGITADNNQDKNYRNGGGLNRLDIHHHAPTETRYLPRGLDKEHNGIIMPSRPGMDQYQQYQPYPYHQQQQAHNQQQCHQQELQANVKLPDTQSSSSMDDGIDSPQWGWFMRTTPPTPQMYQTHNKYPSTGDSSYSSTTSACSASTVPTSYPNPVFQGLHEDNRNRPVEWSSVPL